MDLEFRPPTIADIREALEPIPMIKRPDTDNDGDPLNGSTVFPYLTWVEQQQVAKAYDLLYRYCRTPDGGPDNRALTTLRKNGFPASLDPSQYDPTRLVGFVTVGEWDINISDPVNTTG